MSTPSTATAVLHPHQFYPHYPEYDSSTPLHRLNPSPLGISTKSSHPTYYSHHSNNSSSDMRQSSTARTSHSQNHASGAPSQDSPEMSSARKADKQPDWREFYKNGVPKEVIVIDDDSPEPNQQPDVRNAPTSMPQSASTNGTTRHAEKRRKVAADTHYDPIYRHSNLPATQAAQPENSASNSADSSRRTASVQYSTAPTSLASTSSSSLREGKLDDTQTGQKRKRGTRKSPEAELSKSEIAGQQDAWKSYVPPPKPPIKASDVYVAVVNDKTVPKHQKIDDEDGHFVVMPNTTLTERYSITKLLGQGTFGKVVEAYDHKKNRKCAVKIIRAVQKYRDASRIELRVLATLAANDRNNRNKCIHLRDCFDYRNHICIVTDLLGQSVFDFLKANHFTPFPSTHIQSFARQLFTSVAFLHDLNLIHTDLKPENVLLLSSAYQTFTYNRTIPSSSRGTSRQAKFRKVLLDPEIRLIDFGSATFDDEYHSSVVSTRHYRAPEIILNLGWSFPCDIWSIGCILVEFFTGDALFQTHDNLEHLAMMEAVCNSKIEKDIIKQVQQGGRGSSKNAAASYFSPRGVKLDYPNPETPRTSRKYVKNMKKLTETIPNTSEFNNQFLDLLRRIFVYDPKKRITAKQALQHPWFKESIQDDGTEAVKIRIERERIRTQDLQRTSGYK